MLKFSIFGAAGVRNEKLALMSRRIVVLGLLCLMKSFVISHLFSSYLVHWKLKNISKISKSTSWFRGWKLTIDLTYSRIVNKQLQCVTRFVKALLQGRSARSHFSFIFYLWYVACLSFLYSAVMVSRVSFVSHLSWNSLKVAKIVQTFNFLLALKYFWKLGEREGV